MRKLIPLSMEVGRVIWHFGGPTPLVKALNDIGAVQITVKALQKWRERGVIPMDRWLELMILSKSMNKSLNLNEFLIDEANQLGGLYERT